jgi:hypothetical protein
MPAAIVDAGPLVFDRAEQHHRWVADFVSAAAGFCRSPLQEARCAGIEIDDDVAVSIGRDRGVE